MNSDRLTMIRLAGVVCSPSPERRNENAMAKRVKLVTITSRPGAIDSTVSSPTSWTMRPLALAPACGSTLPRSIDWAWASPANPQRHAATRITRAVPAVLRRRMTSGRNLRVESVLGFRFVVSRVSLAHANRNFDCRLGI